MKKIDHRNRIDKINILIKNHEEKLANILLDYLTTKKNVKNYWEN